MSYSPWLIIKTSALGDVVQTLEALGPISKSLERAGVGLEWVTEPATAPLIALHPLVKMVHVVSTKKWRKQWYQKQTWLQIKEAISRLQYSTYDVALDLQGNVKSALIMRCVHAHKKIGFSRESASEWPASLGLDVQLHTSYERRARDVYRRGFEKAFEVSLASPNLRAEVFNPEDLLWSEYTFSEQTRSLEDYAIVALGSRWINKQPGKELALSLTRLLLEKTSQTLYVATGSQSELQFAKEVVQQIHHPRLKLLPQMELVEYAYAIYKSKWLIGADSLPLHLASWLQVPSFGIFGPSSDFYYAPQGPLHGSWQGSCPYGVEFVKRCSQLRTCSTGACLRQAPNQMVLQSLEKWLNKLQPYRI